jgi:cytosine deaminase
VIEAALTGLGYGATAQRTHVLVDGPDGPARLLASLQAARDLRGLMELQVVAVTATGDLAALRAALDEGAEAVGGAGPTDPHAVLALGARCGVPVDLHTTAVLAAVPEGVPHLLLCGPDRAPAGADLCVLPQSSRCVLGTAGPSGTVAGSGALRDAANPVGRADPLEAAFLLSARSGLRPEAAYARVSAAARRALGLRPVTVEPGHPAELLAVRGNNLEAALAAGHSRVVIHRGRIVSRTSAVREFSDPVPAWRPLPRQNLPRRP